MTKTIIRYRNLALDEREDGTFLVSEGGALLSTLGNYAEGIASFCAALELRLRRTRKEGTP